MFSKRALRFLVPARLRCYLPSSWEGARQLVHNYAVERRRIGSLAAAVLTLADLQPVTAGTSSEQRLKQLKLKGYEHPLWFRRATSDRQVIHQVFVQQEYRILAQLGDPKVIIDCGANIGCTAFYLLSAYPAARVIAIEPDEQNCQVCRKNLAPFDQRAEVLQAAVWPVDEPLKLERGVYRGGLEWSHQVHPCCAGDPEEVPRVTMDELVVHVGATDIDIVKIDIERAELALFKHDCCGWLSRTRNLAVELHDAECQAAFFRAMSGYQYKLLKSGELIFCLNISPLLSPC